MLSELTPTSSIRMFHSDRRAMGSMSIYSINNVNNIINSTFIRM